MLDASVLHDPAVPATWRELALQLRVDAVRLAATAGSGHPTSAMSRGLGHGRHDADACRTMSRGAPSQP
jgi:hypothetical protein